MMKTWIDTRLVEHEHEGRLPDLGGHELDRDVRFSVMLRGDGTCLCRATFPASKEEDILATQSVEERTDEEADRILKKHRPEASLENLDQPDVELDKILNGYDVDEVLDEEEKIIVRVLHNWKRGLTSRERREILSDYNQPSVQKLVHEVSTDQLREIIGQYSLGPVPDHLDTATLARSIVQIPTVGRQVLQDQEVTTIFKVARAEKLSEAGSIPKNTNVLSGGSGTLRVSDAGESIGKLVEGLLRGENKPHRETLRYVKGEATPPWVHSA